MLNSRVRLVVSYGVFCVPAEAKLVALEMGRDRQPIVDSILPFALGILDETTDEGSDIQLACFRYVTAAMVRYHEVLTECGLNPQRRPILIHDDLFDFETIQSIHEQISEIDALGCPFDTSKLLEQAASYDGADQTQVPLPLDGEHFKASHETVSFGALLQTARKLWIAFCRMANDERKIRLIALPDQLAMEVTEYFDHLARAVCHFLAGDITASNRNVHSLRCHLERFILDVHKAICFSLMAYLKEHGNVTSAFWKQWLAVRQSHLFIDPRRSDRLDASLNFTSEILDRMGIDETEIPNTLGNITD